MCVYVPCLQPSQAKGSGGGRRGDSGSGTRRTNYLAHLKHSLDKVRSIRYLSIANKTWSWAFRNYPIHPLCVFMGKFLGSMRVL